MSFTKSESIDPHILRRREILQDHPEVKSLFGREPLTSFYILLIVFAQVVIAFLVKDIAWWWVLVVAYGVGAFLNHALFTLKHECAHNLVLKNKKANFFLGIIANLPSCTPTYASFTTFHLKHHAHKENMIWMLIYRTSGKQN